MKWKPINELPEIKEDDMLPVIAWGDDEEGGDWGMCYVNYEHRMFVLDEAGELIEIEGSTHFFIPEAPGENN